MNVPMTLIEAYHVLDAVIERVESIDDLMREEPSLELGPEQEILGLFAGRLQGLIFAAQKEPLTGIEQ